MHLSCPFPGAEHRPAAPLAQGQPGAALFQELLNDGLVLGETCAALTPEVRAEILDCGDAESLLVRLVERCLLTPYQAGRIRDRKVFGLRLGAYRVLDLLGRGSMCQVFLAEHVRQRQPVAIKVLSLDRPELLPHFDAEMRLTAKLQHPNIVAILDVGEVISVDALTPDLCYFVMEYVPGANLHRRVKSHGPMESSAACRVIHQIAAALDEVHRHRLVHRDIKPSNILISPTGQAKLVDFGLTRELEAADTDLGVLFGTLEYMAPEQLSNSSSVDERADIYGLGGVLFWCLTGRHPHPLQADSARAWTERRNPTPPAPSQLRPEIAPELDAVVGRMLRPDPGDRYPSAAAAMQALCRFSTTTAMNLNIR